MKIHATYGLRERFDIYYFFIVRRFRFAVRMFTFSDGYLGGNSRIFGRRNIVYVGGLNIGDNVTIDARFAKCIEFGKRCSIRDDSYISSLGSIYAPKSGSLLVGSNVGISENCYLQIRGDLVIGDDVIIGPGTTIITENHVHDIDDIPIRCQGVERVGVNIGVGSWIGANVTILDGVSLGPRTIVAAGSIVTKTFDGNCTIGGVPARILTK